MNADLIVHVVDASVRGGRADGDAGRGRRGARRDRRGERPTPARAQQGRPPVERSARRARARHRDAVLVSALTGEGLDALRDAHRGPLPPRPRAGGAARSRTRRAACPSCTRWPATWSARTRPRASSSGRACRPASPSASSASRSTARRDRRRLTLAFTRLGAAAERPGGRTSTTPGYDLLAAEAASHRARGASHRRHRDRSRHPGRLRRPGAPALGAGRPPRHRARERPGPDRRRLPRRGARPALNTDPEEPFEVEVGDRIAQLVVVRVEAADLRDGVRCRRTGARAASARPGGEAGAAALWSCADLGRLAA